MDAFDRSLLNAIQQSVALVREPYAELAGRLACDEPRVLERIATLRRDGVIREVSAIFDAVALGYEQALVALRAPPERLDEAGAVAAGHPGVSHCYGRDGEVNLWLTLAVSPNSRLGLAGSARKLAELCGAGEAMVLPTLRRYKLRVRFDMNEQAGEDDETPADSSATPPRRRPAPRWTDEQFRAVRALQVDLPARPDPFAPLAEAEGLDPDMLLVHAADFLAAGWMRRYAAVLHHRAAGAAENVLVAWAVPEAAADAAGRQCAQLPAISHCYLRPTAPGWPYNLYTMIHGRSRGDCRMTIEEILSTTGLDRHVELWTAREYKKQRVPLFSPDEPAWERIGGQMP